MRNGNMIINNEPRVIQEVVVACQHLPAGTKKLAFD
jgi:hypothetical protein